MTIPSSKLYANIENPSRFNLGPKPSARLISYTPEPLRFLYHAYMAAKETAHDEMCPRVWEGSTSLIGVHRQDPPREELTEFWERIIKDFPPILRMVTFTFELDDIPVAMLNQLVRHVLGTETVGTDDQSVALWVRSWRAFPPTEFDREQSYFTPDSIAGNADANELYTTVMDFLGNAYRQFEELGIPGEDARGIMPMNATYSLVWHINLLTLTNIAQKRSCWVAQSQYWAPLLRTMRDQLMQIADERLGFIFEPPCVFRGTCISPMEQSLRVHGKDPNPPCPKYVELFGDTVADVKGV